jgi:RNA polymerase sigma-70 factor (ECF subfamily)
VHEDVRRAAFKVTDWRSAILTDSGDPNAWGDLMAAAQAGDAAAYRRLLREILPFIRAIARRHHATPDRVEDVVQDVLLTIHRVRNTYDPARPFTHWLGAIAHRRSIDAVRRKIRTDATETFSPIAYETYADPRANKDVEAQAIAALPPGQRQAVELLRLRELSLAEAAAESGQSIGALKVSLHRAIRALRGIIGREDEDGDERD